MKNNSSPLGIFYCNNLLQTFSRRILFITLILFLFLPVVPALAQGEAISIEIRNNTLRDALREIERKSGKKLFMSDDITALNKVISFKASGKNFDQIMDEVLKNTGLTYQTMENGSIIIVEKKDEKIVVTGVLKDENANDVLIGATVTEKGTSNIAVTNMNGQFRITVSSEKAVLTFSYLGYKAQEATVGKKRVLDMALREDSQMLDEIVVVGYGTMKKSDLTGAVASFKAEGAVEKGYTSMEQMLQGQIAGVQITQNSGATGAGITFNIRGATSLSGDSQPLIVVDGYPVNSDDGQTKMSGGSQSGYLGTQPADNALASINPSDIESMEILKDASATAIYGSRGANGVVLITTKRGQAGKNRIEYSFRSDLSSVPKQIEVLGTKEYIEYINEANLYANGVLHSLYNTQEKIDALLATKNTNWQDIIFRTGFSQNHQLTTSGGDAKMRYALTAAYLKQEGIIDQSGFDRGTFRFNFDREFSDKFSFGMNMSGGLTKNMAGTSASDKGEPSMSVIIAALKTRPTQTPYTDDELVDQTFTGNPFALVYMLEDINKSTSVLLNMNAAYKIIPGLTARARGGIERGFSHRDVYHPKGTTLGNVSGGYAFSGDSDRQDYSMEYTLNFEKTINKLHKINAVGGYEYQKWESRRQGANALGFPSDKYLYYDFSSATTSSVATTARDEAALSSFMFRMHYTYADKYLFTFTGRSDGSTRLAPGNQWDFFPALALGWNAHNEEFLKKYDRLSQLKFRASYGLSGNQSIGIGASKHLLGTNGAVIAQSVVTGYYPSNMPDPTLGWEKTYQFNTGFDIGFIQNRFRFTFDYYNKITEDLLINRSLPPSTGYSSYPTNTGKIQNRGYEFSLGADALTGNLTWNINANLSINKNKVLELDNEISSTFAAIGSQVTNISRVGLPMGVFYGYRVVGVYQTQEEIDAEGIIDSVDKFPGAIKFKDSNKDGKIDEDDREIIGNPYPDFTFGLNNSFSWKGLNLSVLVQGSIGQDVINANRHFLDGLITSSEYNISKESWDNRWTGPGTSNTYPKVTLASTNGGGFAGRFTDFIVEDASFVRLKSVSLSYKIPQRYIPFLNSVSLFATGTNLITLTNYKGYDPEVNSRAGFGLRPGIDNGGIPQYRTYSFGLSVNF